MSRSIRRPAHWWPRNSFPRAAHLNERHVVPRQHGARTFRSARESVVPDSQLQIPDAAKLIGEMRKKIDDPGTNWRQQRWGPAVLSCGESIANSPVKSRFTALAVRRYHDSWRITAFGNRPAAAKMSESAAALGLSRAPSSSA